MAYCSSNFVFKTTTKILANRLSRVASRIIDSYQFGFIKGCTIDDCIFGASECVNLLNICCRSDNMALNIDIHKAFDNLEWDFIHKVLTCFGFSPKFARWMRSIFESSHLSIILNDEPRRYFGCSRGVRQGDPL